MAKQTVKTHEEWTVGIRKRFQDKYNEEGYYDALAYCPWMEGVKVKSRYAKSEEEARRALDYVYQLFNGEKLYDRNGKRYEHQNAGHIGISIECTKETDADQMIVAHYIKKRIVTEWEVIEEVK